nr:hypothetical protein [Flavisolibacter nicotianae]
MAELLQFVILYLHHLYLLVQLLGAKLEFSFGFEQFCVFLQGCFGCFACGYQFVLKFFAVGNMNATATRNPFSYPFHLFGVQQHWQVLAFGRQKRQEDFFRITVQLDHGKKVRLKKDAGRNGEKSFYAFSNQFLLCVFQNGRKGFVDDKRGGLVVKGKVSTGRIFKKRFRHAITPR